MQNIERCKWLKVYVVFENHMCYSISHRKTNVMIPTKQNTAKRCKLSMGFSDISWCFLSFSDKWPWQIWQLMSNSIYTLCDQKLLEHFCHWRWWRCSVRSMKYQHGCWLMRKWVVLLVGVKDKTSMLSPFLCNPAFHEITGRNTAWALM